MSARISSSGRVSNKVTPSPPFTTSMKQKKLHITIDRPVGFVFDFTLDPRNTPKWIDFIIQEEANDSVPKLGTVYRNRGADKRWTEYIVTAFEKDTMFVMSRTAKAYHVKYMFRALSPSSTELIYYEWTDDGELEAPFTIESLQRLKAIIEQS